jgi:hypothetical protein
MIFYMVGLTIIFTVTPIAIILWWLHIFFVACLALRAVIWVLAQVGIVINRHIHKFIYLALNLFVLASFTYNRSQLPNDDMAGFMAVIWGIIGTLTLIFTYMLWMPLHLYAKDENF